MTDVVASRLGRVVQQLRSLSDLHARELAGVADLLEAAGLAELAQRLRVYRGLHADEAALVLAELEDLQATVLVPAPPAAATPDAAAPAAPAAPPPTPVTPTMPTMPTTPPPSDPAAASPKRARWLAEQDARTTPRPLSRRDIFTGPS